MSRTGDVVIGLSAGKSKCGFRTWRLVAAQHPKGISEMTGRPSDYSTETTATICERLGMGESLRQICADEAMPGKSTVMRWLHDHKEFRDQYARAREDQAEHWAEEIIQISDDGTNDTQKDEEGHERGVNQDVIARSRLRVDTRKWLMARMAPKKYGDKLDIDQRTTHEVGASVSDLMKAIDGRTRSK